MRVAKKMHEKKDGKVDNMLNYGRSCSPSMHPIAYLHV